MSRKEHPAELRARQAYQESIVLAQWYAAECAAERAAKRKGDLYLAGTVAVWVTSALFAVAVGLLIVDVLR